MEMRILVENDPWEMWLAMLTTKAEDVSIRYCCIFSDVGSFSAGIRAGY